MASPAEVVVVGAGLRGMFSYGLSADADELRFVAVVEPDVLRRTAFSNLHGIAPEYQFASVDEWLAADRIGDAAIIATPDDQHFEPTVAALEAGYHVLLEKPMAQSVEECAALVATAARVERQLHVCHVLRYTPFFRKIREIVSSGRLGDIVTVEHRENVLSVHMAHSYVRGAYGRAAASNPMLLAKCCHDLDILHWVLDDPCVRVGSIGSLRHFRSTSVGPEIPDRCTDGCPVEETCIYAAPRLYAPDRPAMTPDIYGLMQMFPLGDPPAHTPEARREALKTSPFGRCVYRCDNDVVDHQLVTMELESGSSVVLAMQGHSHEEGRTMRYDGTLATLRGTFSDTMSITIHPHGSTEVEVVELPEVDAVGHGGGDRGIMSAFARSLRGDGGLSSDAVTSLESHVLGFAAEEARLTRSVVDLRDYRKRFGLPA